MNDDIEMIRPLLVWLQEHENRAGTSAEILDGKLALDRLEAELLRRRHEIEKFQAENERLRAIEEAARDLFNRGMDHVSQTYSRVAEARLRTALGEEKA